MSETREVRSRVVIEIVGNPAAEIKKFTDEANKAAVAQDGLNKKAKEFSLKEAADAAQEAHERRRAIEQELYNRGVVRDTEAMRLREQDKRRAEAEQAKIESRERQALAKADALARQAQAARQTLAMQGLALSGMGGIGGAYGQGLNIGSMLETAGFGKLGRLAGPIGLAAGTAYEIETRRQANVKANANEYLSSEQRERKWLESLPFGETLAGIFTPGYLTRQRDIERAGEQSQRLEIFERMGIGQRSSRTGMNYQGTEYRALQREISGEQARASANLEAVQRFQLPQINTFDRSTATGARQEREERAMLQTRTELVKAEREMAKAIAEVNINRDKQKKLEAEQAELTRKYNLSRAGIGSGDDASRVGSIKDTITYGNLLEENRQNLDATIRERVGAQRNLYQSERARNEAVLNVRRAEVGVLEEREQAGAEYSTRLGMMGIGGRMTGMAALEAIKSMGIENAPSELIAQAQAIAPKEIGKLAESAGENLPEEFRTRLKELAPEDARDLGGLKDIRNEIDDKRKSIRDDEQASDLQQAQGMNNAVKNLELLIDILGNKLPLALNKLNLEIRLGAAQQ